MHVIKTDMEGNTISTFLITPTLKLEKRSLLPTISVSDQKKRLDNITLDYDPAASKELISIIKESRTKDRQQEYNL